VHWGIVAGALALALCLTPGVRAQGQEQQSQSQEQSQQAQSQDQSQQASGQQQAQSPDQPPAPQQPTTDQQNKPKYASQDADKPPYSNDRLRRNAPPPQNAPQEPGAPQQAAPAPVAPEQPLPSTLTIPAGTILLIRTNDPLSSDHNQVGDHFTATLEQPVVVNGWVVARRGQVLVGQVKTAQKAGRVKGTSQLGLELTDMTLVDGRQAPILTELWKGSGGTSHGQDAATITGTTGLGAALGAVADWGRGAAIGAGAGAVVGIGAVLLTRGRPTELLPETPLSFRLVDPVTIDTTKSQQAFLPFTQEDMNGGRGDHRRPGPYPGPYGPCAYGPCYAYPYPYAYPYVGFYGGYWWGPGYYGYRGYRRW